MQKFQCHTTVAKRRRQRGAASLLLLLLAAMGLMSATFSMMASTRNQQKMQFAAHTATQAHMRAWAGVTAISQAVKGALTQSGVTSSNLATKLGTAGSPVSVSGLTGVSALYRGADANGYLLFDVTGASAGATGTLRVAIHLLGGAGTSSATLSGPLQLTGNTTVSGSASFTGLNTALANITVKSGTLSLSGSASGFGTICSTGDLTISGSVDVETACSNSNVAVSGSSYAKTAVASGTIDASDKNVTTRTISSGPAFPPPPLLAIDAYVLRSQANLTFTGVDAAGNVMVTARKIAGVTDGAYFLARSAGAPDFLCASVAGTNCVNPITRVCYGANPSNSCFAYSSSGGQWTVTAQSMLRLAVAFNGSLQLLDGRFINTMIATGDIAVATGVTVYAPNIVGDGACQGAGYAGSEGSAPVGTLTSYQLSTTYIPTQLCTGSGASAVSSASSLSNVALYAGGYSGANQTGFTGGNVSLSGNAEVYGNVLAGQYISAGASTMISGSIVSGQQGGATSTGNVLGGHSKVRNFGATSFSHISVPCVASSCATPAAYNIAWVAPI
ncbi:MAG: hypothetical protein V4795_08160 [Pseudomonadota bacterium]